MKSVGRQIGETQLPKKERGSHLKRSGGGGMGL